MKTLCALLSLLLLPTGAMAQEGGADPLAAAFETAQSWGDIRISFTMSFEASGAPPVVQRYDAAADEWTRLSGDPRALPKDAQKRLKNVSKSESKPAGILYADFPAYIEQPVLIGIEDGIATYRFVPSQVGEDDVSADGDAPVIARLTVTTDTPTLTRYEVRATEPFKPNAVTSLDAFEVIQEFERIGPDGPAVLVRMVSVQKGKRLLQTLDTDFSARFSNFEIVE